MSSGAADHPGLLQGRLVLQGQPSSEDTRAPHRDSWPPVV